MQFFLYLQFMELKLCTTQKNILKIEKISTFCCCFIVLVCLYFYFNNRERERETRN